MSELKKWVPKPDATVIAVQINLDIEGFAYVKWGAEQHCSPGDWLVDNDGDVYTISDDTFARTYRLERPGLYRKIAPVWAWVAQAKGTIRSEEGETEYEPGDYVAFHAPDAKLGWALKADKFHERYDRAREADPEV